jgi:hypothetical protein
MERIQRFASAPDDGEDLVGVLGPAEGPRILVRLIRK